MSWVLFSFKFVCVHYTGKTWRLSAFSNTFLFQEMKAVSLYYCAGTAISTVPVQLSVMYWYSSISTVPVQLSVMYWYSSISTVPVQLSVMYWYSSISTVPVQLSVMYRYSSISTLPVQPNLYCTGTAISTVPVRLSVLYRYSLISTVPVQLLVLCRYSCQYCTGTVQSVLYRYSCQYCTGTAQPVQLLDYRLDDPGFKSYQGQMFISSSTCPDRLSVTLASYWCTGLKETSYEVSMNGAISSFFRCTFLTCDSFTCMCLWYFYVTSLQ